MDGWTGFGFWRTDKHSRKEEASTIIVDGHGLLKHNSLTGISEIV